MWEQFPIFFTIVVFRESLLDLMAILTPSPWEGVKQRLEPWKKRTEEVQEAFQKDITWSGSCMYLYK